MEYFNCSDVINTYPITGTCNPYSLREIVPKFAEKLNLGTDDESTIHFIEYRLDGIISCIVIPDD